MSSSLTCADVFLVKFDDTLAEDDSDGGAALKNSIAAALKVDCSQEQRQVSGVAAGR